jgi:hypothetical protein
MDGAWWVRLSTRTEDQITESSTDDFRNKFLTPEIITAITGTLSDGDSDVRQAAVDAIGEGIAHGEFDRQIAHITRYLNPQQKIFGINSSLPRSLLL